MSPRPFSSPAHLVDPELLPLLVHIVAAALLVGILLLAAGWLGSKTHTSNKLLPYESGIVPTGSPQFSYPAPFYLVAIFFIVFDVEAAFVFAWAVAWKELGLPGLLHMTFFIVVLLLGLAWLWKKGGLDWGAGRERVRPVSPGKRTGPVA